MATLAALARQKARSNRLNLDLVVLFISPSPSEMQPGSSPKEVKMPLHSTKNGFADVSAMDWFHPNVNLYEQVVNTTPPFAVDATGLRAC
jgi:hypothetical protein